MFISLPDYNFPRHFFGLLLAGLLLPSSVHAAPEVVVSVPPIHSLVSAVMGDVGSPRLLLPGGQSPHAGQLKPSQVRALGAADLIVWVGPALERPMAKIIAQRRAAARVVTLLEEPAITLLSGQREDEWRRAEADGYDHRAHEHDDEHEHEDEHEDEHDEHGYEYENEHEHEHEHDHWQTDPHLWLSFDNARAIVDIAARELANLDPAHRARYESNARAFLLRLERLRRDLREDLRAVRHLPYVVFHDAYRYFENEFDMRPVGVLAVGGERPPGARRIREIRRRIQSENVRCVFSEPQFQPGLVETLVADTDAVAGVLDPLGSGLEPGPDAWFELMRGLADSLAGCLGRAS